MRVCWNWQTGTFEGRVSLTYGFKSRHSHQKESTCFGKCFFQRNKSLAGFVKFALQVKYGFAMWNACGRGWISFHRNLMVSISPEAQPRISHLPQGKYFTDKCSCRCKPTSKFCGGIFAGYNIIPSNRCD